MNRSCALLAEHVSKTYTGQRFFRRSGEVSYALRDVSFSIERGETLGLLGPNGAGKTTLLKIISTLLFPTSGRVLVHGYDVCTQTPEARRNLGLVTSDERSFYWRLTGRQNLEFFAALYKVPHSAVAGRIEMLLEVTGLSYAADRPFHGYSSGMKQKLAIARGLLNDPPVVLFDEPTRALDPLSTQHIRKWIGESRLRSPEQSMLIATNQLQEAEQLCDRVLIINRGAVIACGAIHQIRENWRRHDYAVHKISYRGPDPGLYPDPEIGLFDIVDEGIEGDASTLRLRTLKDSDALHHVLTAIMAAGGRVVRCDSEQITFDEVFCDLVASASAGSEPAPVAAAQEVER